MPPGKGDRVSSQLLDDGRALAAEPVYVVAETSESAAWLPVQA